MRKLAKEALYSRRDYKRTADGQKAQLDHLAFNALIESVRRNDPDGSKGLALLQEVLESERKEDKKS